MNATGPASPRTPSAATRRYLHVLAWTTWGLCVCLLFAGALVTSYNVGMAVPDGATTFGQTLWSYNFFGQPFGVVVEHTHRLWGMAVGLAALVLYVSIFFLDERPYVRWAATIAIWLVVGQGLLGRYRVDKNAEYGDVLKAVHGGFAQLVFASLTALVAMTSAAWRNATPLPHPRAPWLRRFTLAMAAAAYVQIVLGVMLRHRNQLFHVHATLAYGLALAALWLGAQILLDGEWRRRFGTLALLLGGCLFAQVVLGNAAAISTGLTPPELRPPVRNVTALTTSFHLLVGSFFFAATLAIALFSFRQLRPAEANA
ncbi:MAG TPA: COX15/CtaA family protein [Planctomycetia bacterium]|nr:COX15/CtaA family protein [Planctomycetia bacterium]